MESLIKSARELERKLWVLAIESAENDMLEMRVKDHNALIFRNYEKLYNNLEKPCK